MLAETNTDERESGYVFGSCKNQRASDPGDDDMPKAGMAFEPIYLIRSLQRTHGSWAIDR